jgi:multidrug transporter EmrE-like cation transporter
LVAKILIYLILTVNGLFLFKKGGNGNTFELSFYNIKMNLSTLSIVGIICYALSFLMWLSIIKDNNLSYIYPIANGLVTILTVLGGIYIFKEKINIIQVIGTILIILGVLLINLKK